ncbi:hypothetical protein AGLY_000595 [Aphis glycines]|uniref:Uncharacterized protein n=1 Tax=Aphis glycines TaxID=307491 RepID=A0A6G0U9T5_APHGL|nr:hypothetical protein AGLY_000595 [Aphis glycines]
MSPQTSSSSLAEENASSMYDTNRDSDPLATDRSGVDGGVCGNEHADKRSASFAHSSSMSDADIRSEERRSSSSGKQPPMNLEVFSLQGGSSIRANGTLLTSARSQFVYFAFQTRHAFGLLAGLSAVGVIQVGFPVSFSAAISENCLYASKRAFSKLRLVISDDSAWSRSCLYASFFSRSRRSFHLTILSFSLRTFSQSSSSRITFSSCKNIPSPGSPAVSLAHGACRSNCHVLPARQSEKTSHKILLKYSQYPFLPSPQCVFIVHQNYTYNKSGQQRARSPAAQRYHHSPRTA